MASPASDPKRYQHVVVSGLPFVRGQSHGIQAKDKIIRGIERYKHSKTMPSWKECVEFVQKNYMEATEKYFPAGLEEMKGIANGAGVTIEDIMILNARYDLSRWQRWRTIQGLTQTELVKNKTEEECTGTACLSKATKHGDVLIGQNWDLYSFIVEEDTAILLEVIPDPSENIPKLVMLGEAGQLGRTGMNANGLGILAMGLWSSADQFTRDENSKMGWVPITLLRRFFLQSPTFTKGQRDMLRLPRHVSNNLILATSEGEAINLELIPSQYFILYTDIDKDFLTHANNFKSMSFLCRADVKEGIRGGSSLFRDRRLERGLLEAWPKIDEDAIINALKDHLGYPDSLCEHAVTDEDRKYTKISPNSCTVACMVYNLTKRVVKLCKGPPCEGEFVQINI